MADSEISVKVVADLEDIKKSLKEIAASSKKSSEDIGDSFGSTTGKVALFATGLNQAVELAGKVASAIKRITVELAIAGERAAQVENGFKLLADSAGIATDDLLRGILKSNDGIIEQTELLSRSSKLIVAFGTEARRIPEILELSRKVAVSFGMDAGEAFERLSGAIQSGNAKGLKQLGIIVDTEKAVREYAAANGIASNALSDVGRAQAIMNAALDSGAKKFQSIALESDTVANSYSRFGNSVSDSTEKIGQAIVRTGLLQKTFNVLADAVTHFTNVFQAAFGNPADQAKAKIIELDRTIKSLNDEMARLQAGGQAFGATSVESLQKQITGFNKIRNDLLSQGGVGEQFGPEAPAAASGKGAIGEDAVNKNQLLKNEVEFRKQINQIRLQSIEQGLKLAATDEELDKAQKDRAVQKEEALALRKQEIKNNDILSEQQKRLMIEELETQHQFMLLEIERSAENERIAMLQTRLEMSRSFDEQVAVSAELQSMRVSQAWNRAGGLGGKSVDAFGKRSVNAFKQMGEGSKSASEALSGAALGMVSDVAGAYGQMLMLTSIWPPNPAAFIAGAALVALSGALGAKAGGAGQTAGGGGGGGMGGDFGGPSFTQESVKSKEVTINIEGNYFESEQTKLAIVEAVRSSSDATDFTVQRGNR